MCELLGVSSSEKIEMNDLLSEFFSHGVRHPNGWGMAFFDGNSVSAEKQPEPSFKSKYLRQRLRARIITDCMFAHIRLATKGTTIYENTHPFTEQDNSGRNWTLQHNGTVFDCGPLNRFVHVQKGQTDSERILLYIVSQINDAQDRLRRTLTPEERFRLIDSIILEIAPGNKVILMIYDGEYMYIHTNSKDKLFMCRKGGALLFATVPLDGGRWDPVPLMKLLVFKDGKCVFTGTQHNNLFNYTEEQKRLLFLDYANL